MDEKRSGGVFSRRRLLTYGAATGAASLAGCGFFDQETPEAEDSGVAPEWIGSGPGAFGDRPEPGGTSMDDMPAMAGTVTVYSGRGEALVADLFEYLQETRYPNLTIETRYAPAGDLVNQIQTEGENTPADVFFTVDAGSLGRLGEADAFESVSEETASLVGAAYRNSDGSWVGTSGRARTVPYNTNQLDESDVPDDIMAFPDQDQYAGEIGWTPTYASFQDFLTAMVILEGESATRNWVAGMVDLDVQEYPDEAQVARAVADGEIALGFTNHYYIQRELASRPDAPLETAFTTDDAGTIFNVAGAGRIAASTNPDLADLFVRHLLSAEAQEYFAIRTFEYPLVEGVDPVGRIPPVSELQVPDIDLSQLANQETTEEILREFNLI